MRLGDEPSPPWARRGRRTGGKEGPCLVGAGQSPAAAEAAEDPRARTAFPPRADGRLHGTGGQLDRHSDGACDPARRPCGPAATGEGEAPLASAAVHSAAGRQAPIPCTPREARAAFSAHGLCAGLPQRESGLHRRVLGHAERARLRAAPPATGSPPPPQPRQETPATPGPRKPAGQKRARVGAGPTAQTSQRASFLLSPQHALLV